MNEKKKIESTAIFDLDNTLLFKGILTRILGFASRKILELAIMFQKTDRETLNRLKEYEKVIIVTARSGPELREVTVRQLRKNKIRYDELILFPGFKFRMWWKKRVFKLVGPADLYDDRREEIENAPENLTDLDMKDT